jgi:hypothetical protein
VLTTGHIPRGIARTKPEWSPERTDAARAREGFAAFRRRLAGLEPRLPEIATARGTTRHFRLGGFTASRWVRFLAIHQAHHLAIIDDVRRAAARGDR